MAKAMLKMRPMRCMHNLKNLSNSLKANNLLKIKKKHKLPESLDESDFHGTLLKAPLFYFLWNNIGVFR